MHKVKGTGIMIVKKLVQDQGAEAEKKVRERLSSHSTAIWDSTTLALSWVDDELAVPGSILYEAALRLFPGDAQTALATLGKVMAKEGLPVFYKMFIRIPTPQFVYKSVAQLWRRFYFDGDAVVENLGPKEATFVLRNFPDYNENMRTYMKGYLFGMGDLLGLKNMTVDIRDSDPQAWKWIIAWN